MILQISKILLSIVIRT